MTEQQGEREKQAGEHCTSTYLQKPEHRTHSPYTIIYTHTDWHTIFAIHGHMHILHCIFSHTYSHGHRHTTSCTHSCMHTHTLMHTLYTHCTHRHTSTLYLQYVLMHTHCIKYSHVLIVVLTFLSTRYTWCTCFSL